MAEKRTINIDINSNASEAEKDFKSFNKAVDETTKSAKNLDATFEEVYGELQPLTTRMGEAEDRLYELALAGDTASKEYQELLTKVGEYRKVQIQTDLAVDGAAQTMTQKLGSALNGATSGFAATQGAMALFGSENEALEKSLLKVQSALAIQQGVKGLSDAYKELSIGTKLAAAGQAAFTFVTGAATTGLKLFRLALISTGIGAIVVAIGLLIANFDKLLIPLNAAKNALKSFGDAIGLTDFAEKERAEEQRKRFEEEKKEREEIIKLLQEEREEIQKQNDLQQRYSNARILALQTQKKLAQGNAEEISEIEKEISSEKIAQLKKDQQTLIDDQIKVLGQLEQEVANNAAAELRIQQGLSIAGEDFYKKKENSDKKYYELKEQLRTNDFQGVIDIDNQIASIQADETIREKEELKKRQDNYKQYAAERLSIARKIEDIENSLLTDGIEKELEINRDKFRRLREDVKGNREERKILTDLYNQQEAQAEAKIIADNQKRREDAFETERSERVELLNFVDELNTKEVESEKAKNLAILDNAVETNEKLIESDKAVAEAKKNIQDAQMANIEAGISLLKDVAGENNKLQALAIAAESAVSIAKTIITTQAANAAATAQGAALGITTAGASVAAATALVTQNNISAGISIAAQIAAAAKGISALGGGASAPSGGNVGGGGASSAAVPNFNVVGDSGINQIAALQQQPVQAFVVSGEVTTSQALDRNRVQNATL